MATGYVRYLVPGTLVVTTGDVAIVRIEEQKPYVCSHHQAKAGELSVDARR